MALSLAIIIPCYNEAKRLNPDAFLKLIASPTWHIYFVNDGSTDNTADLLSNFKLAAPSQINIISLERNVGKGEAVRKGFLAAMEHSYEQLGFLDADLSTPTSEFIRLTQLFNGHTSVVFGSRIKKANTHIKRTMFRHIVGRFIATIIDWRFNLGIYDTQCGAKLFKSSALKPIIQTPFRTSWLFDVEIFIRLKKQNNNLICHEETLLIWEDDKKSNLSIVSFPLIFKELINLISYY